MEVPSKPRFEHVLNKAREFILDEEICSLPVNPLELARKLDLGPEPYSQYGLHYTVDGFILRKHGISRIFYNDRIPSPERINWTIMHEIAHDILGHFHLSEDFIDGKYGVLEVEANLFAREVLAPYVVLSELDVKSHEEIVELCGISTQAACKRLHELKNYIRCFHYVAKDFAISKRFRQFLRSKGVRIEEIPWGNLTIIKRGNPGFKVKIGGKIY